LGHHNTYFYEVSLISEQQFISHCADPDGLLQQTQEMQLQLPVSTVRW